MKQTNLTMGVLSCVKGVVTNGFTFYAPQKNNTLMEFRVVKMLYARRDSDNIESVDFFAENSKGEIMEFNYTLNHYPDFGTLVTKPFLSDIEIYDSVDDFIDNKPIKFYFERHNVSFYAPYEKINLVTWNGKMMTSTTYYRITDKGIKSCCNRLAEFELRSDRNGELWGKFTQDFPDDMYDSEDAAKQALREKLNVVPLETKTKPAPQISITINISPSDSDEDILNKIKTSFIEM